MWVFVLHHIPFVLGLVVFQPIGDWAKSPCNLFFILCVFIVHITSIIQNIDLFSFLKTIFHCWSLHIVLSRWVSTLWTSYCTVRLCCQRSTSCLLHCRLETPTERSDLQQRTRCWPQSQVSVNKNASVEWLPLLMWEWLICSDFICLHW